MQFLDDIYHSVIDETFLDLGRLITIHLPPLQEQDNTITQRQPQANQFNPFFGRTPVPSVNTRNTGFKVTPRDVQYHAHIKIGPVAGDDTTGMGDLKANQLQLTLDIRALEHITQALSVSVEGRRYTLDETRPIGFSSRRYIIVKMTEVNESQVPSPNETDG